MIFQIPSQMIALASTSSSKEANRVSLNPHFSPNMVVSLEKGGMPYLTPYEGNQDSFHLEFGGKTWYTSRSGASAEGEVDRSPCTYIVKNFSKCRQGIVLPKEDVQIKIFVYEEIVVIFTDPNYLFVGSVYENFKGTLSSFLERDSRPDDFRSETVETAAIDFISLGQETYEKQFYYSKYSSICDHYADLYGNFRKSLRRLARLLTKPKYLIENWYDQQKEYSCDLSLFNIFYNSSVEEYFKVAGNDYLGYWVQEVFQTEEEARASLKETGVIFPLDTNTFFIKEVEPTYYNCDGQDMTELAQAIFDFQNPLTGEIEKVDYEVYLTQVEFLAYVTGNKTWDHLQQRLKRFATVKWKKQGASSKIRALAEFLHTNPPEEGWSEIPITIDYSYLVGNCRPGTEDFLRQIGWDLSQQEATVGEIWQKAKEVGLENRYEFRSTVALAILQADPEFDKNSLLENYEDYDDYDSAEDDDFNY